MAQTKRHEITLLTVQGFTFNPFQENTYLVWDDSKQAVLIDPGCHNEREYQLLLDFVEENQIRVVKLLNTHCHVDHVLGNAWAKRTFEVKLGIHPKDEPTLRAVQAYAGQWGFHGYEAAEPDYFLSEGEAITWGESGKFDVRFVPGHAPGHVVFWSSEDGFCINGDVLFRESIGRTDLPGGDQTTLVESIKKEMFSLPDETLIYCGHGPETTIGHEKKHNPFVGEGGMFVR